MTRRPDRRAVTGAGASRPRGGCRHRAPAHGDGRLWHHGEPAHTRRGRLQLLAVAAGDGDLPGIVGTAFEVTHASAISIPLGIADAIYLIEYGHGKLATTIRSFTDVMTGVPSVFVGLFVYSTLIREIGFGTFVCALARSNVMLPIVARSCEEMLKLVPQDLRRGACALGARRWQVVTRTVLATAARGLGPGSFLVVARAVGETAPLLLATVVVFGVARGGPAGAACSRC